MKKNLNYVFVLLLALALAACGVGNGDTASRNAEEICGERPSWATESNSFCNQETREWIPRAVAPEEDPLTEEVRRACGDDGIIEYVELDRVRYDCEDFRQPGTAIPSATGVPETDLANLRPFTPDWTGLSAECPSYAEVLEVHGLTSSMLEPKSSIEVNVDPQVWETCTYAIEFLPELRGTTIPLENGYAYDVALVGDSNQPLWGGDPRVPTATLQWGTIFRWGPAFQGEDNPGRWLNPNNPDQWAVNLCKEGRYLSTPEAGLDRFPYFNRVGPWVPGTGNLDVGGWTPPGIDEFIPRDYMDAACMLGGRAVESEWKFENGNVRWRYTGKIDGSGTYCASNDFCWQTAYIPRATVETGGYVELWDGKAGKSRTFGYSDLATLLNGSWNVDEFSYHPFGR